MVDGFPLGVLKSFSPSLERLSLSGNFRNWESHDSLSPLHHSPPFLGGPQLNDLRIGISSRYFPSIFTWLKSETFGYDISGLSFLKVNLNGDLVSSPGLPLYRHLHDLLAVCFPTQVDLEIDPGMEGSFA